MDTGFRLWRARRRHDRIDAVLRRDRPGWVLEFLRNDRVMVTRRYPRKPAARADARARLGELLRAGWTDHW